ncbi:TetR/AcrR family transcriptional regulator [Robertmurraya korlensis]|uniref:TetR/AcrR family transcriptional regulator n=1 Tax=Robertmurraya korlensis TaxID=519977 RepID=UPI00082595C7|nr:TetR/AcrR family transcriptional regulator [Robertmurraya korlensis]
MNETKSTKEKILDVATELFSQKGFSGVSIREITKEVGIKESSLYNHFKNKDEILETILSNFRVEFAKIIPTKDQLDAILASSTLEGFFIRGFERFQEHLSREKNERCWRILSNEQYRLPAAREIYLHDVIGLSLQFLETVFAKLIVLGKLKDTYKPAVLASEYQYTMFAMLTEYHLLRFDGKDTTEIEQKMKNHVRFFLDTIKI